MKFATLSFLFGLCLIAPFPLRAQKPAAAPLGKAPSRWPGIELEIARIGRIPPAHLLLAIRVRAGAGAPPLTLLGFPRPVVPGAPVMAGDEVPDPYSLRNAVLTDPATGRKYPALADLPASPFWGPNQLISSIRPGEWVQMAVQFPAPPPPAPGPDGKVPQQRVEILLPHAKEPIRNVPLPLPQTLNPAS